MHVTLLFSNLPVFVPVVGLIKLALEAGKATPAPPVGPALGAKGVNIMMFCKEYNAKTADKAGYIIPVEITVFDVCELIAVPCRVAVIRCRRSNDLRTDLAFPLLNAGLLDPV